MSVPRRVARAYRRPIPLLLGLALAGGGACTAGNPELPASEQVTGASTALSNKVDILLMVDNSSSMTSMQQKMLAEFPVFVQTLRALPAGLPDLHLAVISSDRMRPVPVLSMFGSLCTTPEASFSPILSGSDRSVPQSSSRTMTS